jgi:hypothetical protein
MPERTIEASTMTISETADIIAIKEKAADDRSSDLKDCLSIHDAASSFRDERTILQKNSGASIFDSEPTL